MADNLSWLLERNVFDDGNPQRIAEILKARGIHWVQAEYVSTEGDEQSLRPIKPTQFANDDTVFVYGSMNLCRWLRHSHRWPKLAWYDFDRLRCQTYYAHWGEHLLQQDYAMLPLAEVSRRRAWLFRIFNVDSRIFIRPDDNAKTFSGGVVNEADFDTWWKRVNFYTPAPDALAIVARPQSIQAEWRLVIAGRRVIAGSTYRVAGRESIEAGYPAEAAQFAERVASEGFEPHPVYVMDVCLAQDAYRIVEIGSICCASLYACDLQDVVDAIADAAP